MVRQHHHVRGRVVGPRLGFHAHLSHHAGFARAEAETASVRVGIDEMVNGLREDGQRAEMAEAEKAYAKDPTKENWSRLQERMVTVHQQDQVNKEKGYSDFVTVDGLQNSHHKMEQKS